MKMDNLMNCDKDYIQRRRDELRHEMSHTLICLKVINENRYEIGSEYKLIDYLIGQIQNILDNFNENTNKLKESPEDQWEL